jgi:GNAT superfamily N-acetyltransferase
MKIKEMSLLEVHLNYKLMCALARLTLPYEIKIVTSSLLDELLLRRIPREAREHRVWIIEEDEIPVAWTMLYPSKVLCLYTHDTKVLDKKIARLHLYVSPEHRRKKYGKTLVEKAAAYAHTKLSSLLGVFPWDTRSTEFFVSLSMSDSRIAILHPMYDLSFREARQRTHASYYEVPPKIAYVVA